MDTTTPPHSTVSRLYAVRKLREHLLTLTDDDHSMCEVASRKGILCQGFSRWSEKELKERFARLVARRPGLNRWQLEALGNKWELARQIVDNVPIACDVQKMEHDTCQGWDDFSNQDLARFASELLGWNVTVVDRVDDPPSGEPGGDVGHPERS